MRTTVCCLVIRLGAGLRLRLDLVSGWLAVMHRYFVLLFVVVVTLPTLHVKFIFSDVREIVSL